MELTTFLVKFGCNVDFLGYILVCNMIPVHNAELWRFKYNDSNDAENNNKFNDELHN